MPKNMMLASPLSRAPQTYMAFGEPPASQAASRECSALKNVEDSASGGNLPHSSPSLRERGRAAPDAYATGLGALRLTKIHEDCFAVFGLATIHIFWPCRPEPRAAGRECEAFGNIKGGSVRLIRLSCFSPEHGSGVRASRTMRTTRKPYKALRR
jgi:hypothetical protein